MARKLYDFRVWFSTSEGERIFRKVEAMNIETAIKKAEEIINREKLASHDEKDWKISYVQQEKEGGAGGVRVEIIPSIHHKTATI